MERLVVLYILEKVFYGLNYLFLHHVADLFSAIYNASFKCNSNSIAFFKRCAVFIDAIVLKRLVDLAFYVICYSVCKPSKRLCAFFEQPFCDTHSSHKRSLHKPPKAHCDFVPFNAV